MMKLTEKLRIIKKPLIKKAYTSDFGCVSFFCFVERNCLETVGKKVRFYMVLSVFVIQSVQSNSLLY